MSFNSNFSISVTLSIAITISHVIQSEFIFYFFQNTQSMTFLSDVGKHRLVILNILSFSAFG